MRGFLIIIGVTGLGLWFVPTASGAIDTFLQIKAERDMRDRHAARTGRPVSAARHVVQVWTPHEKLRAASFGRVTRSAE